MKRVVVFILFVACFFCTQLCVAEYLAPEGIFVREGLENRIGFWREMFTRYGEHDLVFHYRNYPWLIYSVLHVGDMKGDNYKEFVASRDEAVSREKKRIQNALYALANGQTPESELEHHIAQMFMKLPGGRNKYLLALAEDQLRYQSGVRELFSKGVVYSGRYLRDIETILEHEGVPGEISRLPLVESSFNYNAYSSVGAAGIWQFMPATAKKYMTVGKSIDERRDPLQSTRAAAKYLKHAYSVLGSWPLAITSYNHGVSGVKRAMNEVGSSDIRKIIKGYMGSSFGFASQNFYCEFIAALEVEKNYRQYFPELKKEGHRSLQEVRLERSHNINDLVRRFGVDKKTLISYNPAFLAPITKGRANVPAGYLVKVPAGRTSSTLRTAPAAEVGNTFAELKTIGAAEQEKSYENFKNTYVVQKKDTVFKLARKFNVSSHELMAANNLLNPKALRVGRTIRVPEKKQDLPKARVRESEKQGEKTVDNANAAPGLEQVGDKYYTVQSGDSVYSIARKNGLKVDDLKRINSLKSSVIKPGQKLKLN
ncbi:MAG: LysM peptidoglycan-binding domain-containing protein [Deltaproteobacteria bacterium]|nr:LysM peptidoglycan-binding domain-containing protein [Deltaproteobacteria bacterium]